MAEALKVFIKAFCKEFTTVPEWQALSSYDRSVKSKYEPSRIYRLEPDVVLARAIRSFSATSDYGSFAELVRDRTSNGSPVARALRGDAQQVSQELMRSGRGYLNINLQDELKAGFVCKAEFRHAFDEALRHDGLAYDLDGFWRAVDSELAELYRVSADDYESIIDAQAAAISACVYACLTGARDNRQPMGFALETTPVAIGRVDSAFTPVPSGEAQLVPVVMAGPDPVDYCVQVAGDANDGCGTVSVYRFSAEQGARIGRQDEAWCAADGHCPVITKAAYASRHHCEIEFKGGRWIVTDVGTDGKGSTSGTLITPADLDALPVLMHKESDNPIRSCELHHGDMICVHPQPVTEGGYDAAYYSWTSHVPDENYRFEVLA